MSNFFSAIFSFLLRDNQLLSGWQDTFTFSLRGKSPLQSADTYRLFHKRKEHKAYMYRKRYSAQVCIVICNTIFITTLYIQNTGKHMNISSWSDTTIANNTVQYMLYTVYMLVIGFQKTYVQYSPGQHYAYLDIKSLVIMFYLPFFRIRCMH